MDKLASELTKELENKDSHALTVTRTTIGSDEDPDAEKEDTVTTATIPPESALPEAIITTKTTPTSAVIKTTQTVTKTIVEITRTFSKEWLNTIEQQAMGNDIKVLDEAFPFLWEQIDAFVDKVTYDHPDVVPLLTGGMVPCLQSS